MGRPLRSELPVLFGEVDLAAGTWADERKHMVMVEMPSRLKAHGVPRVYVNRHMAIQLRQAFDNVVERGLAAEFLSFDGCFHIRKQRHDLLRASVHSWGMAVDVNAITNKLGEKGNLSPEFVACFEDVGFVWGGRWKCPDPMHFQYVEED